MENTLRIMKALNSIDEDEMLTAFKLLHNQFGVIKGTACRIAVSKTNPHLDIAVFDIK